MKILRHKLTIFLILVLFSCGAFWLLIINPGVPGRPSLSPYPSGKNFAFTITDDPDGNKLAKKRIIYDFFNELGLKITVPIWIKEPNRTNGVPDLSISKSWGAGDSCDSEAYLAFILEQQKEGHEIAIHTVSAGNDLREDTIEGYEKYKNLFGEYPSINIMHSSNLENVYWGTKVVQNTIVRKFLSLTAKRSNFPFSGEDPDSKYFWGDILKEKTKYVRLWGTKNINTLKINPSMPYFDPAKPYVNYWFSFSDGWTVDEFNELISVANVETLIEERGACIVYAHLASGFVKKGVVDETFKKRLSSLVSQKDGWFVPATSLLDRLLLMKRVVLTAVGDLIFITNFNEVDVEGVTLLVELADIYYDVEGARLENNDEGEIVLQNLGAGETIVLTKNQKAPRSINEGASLIENMRLFLHRIYVFISHHYNR